MTLTDVMRTMPWGLHDAYLVKIGIDYEARAVDVDVRLKMAADQTSDQLARLHFAGMEYFAGLPPDAPHEQPDALPWIDQLHETSPQFDELRAKHPPVPEGCFFAAFYTRESWQYFTICARDVTLTWLEAEPVPVKHHKP
ncbi:MAG: hypothetical protein Q8L14_41280 [Myxococcales bacterium]|nr:hypothetical protein [Myxococcales bacterium]